jgi:hypothetical protein
MSKRQPVPRSNVPDTKFASVKSAMLKTVPFRTFTLPPLDSWKSEASAKLMEMFAFSVPPFTRIAFAMRVDPELRFRVVPVGTSTSNPVLFVTASDTPPPTVNSPLPLS